VTSSRPNQIIYGANKPEPPRKVKPGPSLARSLFSLTITIGLIVGAVYGFLALWQMSSPGEVNVPQVVGLDQAAAELMLQHGGLEYLVVADRPSDSVAEGKVLEAQPAPGRIVKQGRRISLTISTGSAWTNVPNIREMSERRAETVLKEKLLYLGKRSYINSDKLPKGFIIEQSPDPATRVRRDSEVQAVVSQGPAPAGDNSGTTPDNPPSGEGNSEGNSPPDSAPQ
jgi:eukaryotic-like serine/threonine-protein kinase